MKKIIIASLLAASAAVAQANTNDPAIAAAFTNIEKLVNDKKFTQAHQELDKLAKKGNAQALYNLGYLTQTGQGTKKDEKRAIQFYEQSSNKGYPVASYVLAKNYLAGSMGLTQDVEKAKKLLESASKQGFHDAMVEYAVLLFSESKEESDQKALKLLEPLIKAENPQAMHAKSIFDLSKGLRTRNESTVKSGLSQIQQLAQKGYIPALMTMGNMLTNGKVVEQDLSKAKEIFAALAESNVPQAKESLAVVNKMLAEKTSPSTPAKKS